MKQIWIPGKTFHAFSTEIFNLHKPVWFEKAFSTIFFFFSDVALRFSKLGDTFLINWNWLGLDEVNDNMAKHNK